MSTFKVLFKQPKENILSTIKKKTLLKSINVLIILAILSMLIVASVQNNDLFLSELSVGGAIVIMVCVINILSGD